MICPTMICRTRFDAANRIIDETRGNFNAPRASQDEHFCSDEWTVKC